MGAFCGFTDCLPGSVIKGIIYGDSVYQKGKIRETKAINEAYELGNEV